MPPGSLHLQVCKDRPHRLASREPAIRQREEGVTTTASAKEAAAVQLRPQGVDAAASRVSVFVVHPRGVHLHSTVPPSFSEVLTF